MDISPYIENNNKNFVFFSEIPETTKERPCVLGIDEAGRGPVLGPMVYGIAYCPVDRNDDLKNLGVDDSKTLTEEQREGLLAKLEQNQDYIGFAVHVLSPKYISSSMYRRGKYNLNRLVSFCSSKMCQKCIILIV
jgi:ribonuclease H2 subunit A